MITNSDDLIDSRDVIARISELNDDISALADDPDALPWGDMDEVDERAQLVELEQQGECASGDWLHGATLIRDSYFKDYAIEFAGEIGAISDDARWPATCIDWDQAARELQMDYTSVEFDGVTYWVRS